MKFEKPLLHGKFLRRYKRFFADVELESGEVVAAHCPNTGSMKGLIEVECGAYVTPNNDPKRKLKFTLEMLELPATLVGVNTSRPNKIVAQAIADGDISELAGYENIRHEVKYGENSRIDLLLESAGKPSCYVEVKNVTLAEGSVAMFPDAVTTRGTKHLNELANMVVQGHRAVMVYLVQRTDCTEFKPADDIDIVYAKTLRKVMDAGVEAVCYDCELTTNEIIVRRQLAIRM